MRVNQLQAGGNGEGVGDAVDKVTVNRAGRRKEEAMKLTQTALKRYVSRIGKESFSTGWYYATEENKYNLGIKALCCDIYNLNEKIEKSNSIKKSLTDDIKKEWNIIIDKFYVNMDNK